MSPRRATDPLDELDDDAALRAHGYRPELARRIGGFGNFAISFSVICILAGGMTLFGYGLNTGGPAVMIWGWIGIGAMTMLLGACLAEVTSAYPTSGGLYYMADRLGGPRWAWVTGWLNLLGLLGAIAGIDYGCALFVGAFANLQWGLAPTPETTIGIFAAILLLHGALNAAGVRLVNVLNAISVWWQVGGVLLIAGTLTLAPAQHQSVGFVFGHFANGTGFTSPVYVAALGCLLAAYTFCGYDASSHLSEETTRAQIAAPLGIVRSIGYSWIAGFVLLAGMLFAVQDYAGTLGTSTGVPPAQIFIDVLGTGVAKGLLLVAIVAQLFCGNAETAAASRMVYAFSRDGALPFSSTWRRVSHRTRTPIAAVWLSVSVALVLALPSLYSPTAYAAVTAINVIGITPAYAIPVYLRLRAGDRFRPGPWHLGRWSKPLGWISVTYVTVLTVVFCLPQASPITAESFNYAGVALAVVLVLAWLMWTTKGQARLPDPHPRQRSREHRPCQGRGVMNDQTIKRSCQTPHLSGLLSPDELRAAVHSGEITTVMLAVPDMMGRLKGKRLSASVFLDRMLSKAEACAYILATDVDMTPLEGFDLTGWDDGYGDLSVIPSQDTIRVLPYLPGAVLIHADVADEGGELLEIAPRHMLRTQLDKLAALGLEVRVGLESEFVLYQGSPLQAHAARYRGLQPVAFHNLDYALDLPPALTDFFQHLEGALHGAGAPVESVKTEGALGQLVPYGTSRNGAA